MATDTPTSYRNLVIYEVYVRNHGPNGTFQDVVSDLERIRDMAVDILWFMPIHTIGKVGRKGSLGSPYSIADYRAINPDYGSVEDFSRLIEKAHALGMRVMIDVVYNHTAHDSNLVKEHPDWYHQNEHGEPITTVPAWSDVIDLKYPNPVLEEYLIETLVGWVRFGVDGFRCDVASLIPADFWVRARARCAEINPGTIWLAESVHASFVGSRRQVGLHAISDSELYLSGFDIEYCYDIWPIWQAAVTGKEPVSRYLEMVRFQECIYPANYNKLRCVENHDQARIQLLAPTRERALSWTAFEAFNKGAFLIYGGQEAAANHTPNLFDIDKIDWNGYPLSTYLTTLAKLKKDAAMVSGVFTVSAAQPAIVAEWESPEGCLLGVFNVDGCTGPVDLPLPDGDYPDMLYGNVIEVRAGQTSIPNTAVILRYQAPVTPHWFYSVLHDLNIPRDSP